MRREVRHYPETWVDVESLGARRPFLPTFPVSPPLPAIQDYLDAPVHGVKIDVGVPGSLRREDAGKLFELAYHASGDILELGTAEGLSASILARALLESGRQNTVVSVDVDPRKQAVAARHLAHLDRAHLVHLATADAIEACRSLRADHRRFGLIFVDFARSYDAVLRVCGLLDGLVTPGGFVLFHDFNDRRSREEGPDPYRVYQAVIDGLPATFAFSGVFGCCGLFHGPGTPPNDETGQVCVMHEERG